MKVAIAGGGNAGKATAVYLAQKGIEVCLFTRDREKAALINREGIKAEGRIKGDFKVRASTDIEEAADGAEFIIVQTVAKGHRPLAELLSGKLARRQEIIIFNGNWGAAEFDSVLSREVSEKDALICETAAQLFLCSSSAGNKVNITGIKDNIAFASSLPEMTDEALLRASALFPQLGRAENIIDTSANSSNPIIHGPIAAFNITRMENGEDYTLFGTALPRRLVEFIESADSERCAVIEKTGTRSMTVTDILNSFWPDKKPDLYSALKDNAAYEGIKGPKTTAHRYIEEDIPYGLVPIAKAGRLLSVDTPHIDAVISALSLYLDRDFMSEGPEITREQLKF